MGNFNKYAKHALLASFALLWNACDDSSSASTCDNGCENSSSSSVKEQSSSSSEISSSSEMLASSSSKKVASSSSKEVSSSSESIVAPMYGVQLCEGDECNLTEETACYQIADELPQKYVCDGDDSVRTEQEFYQHVQEMRQSGNENFASNCEEAVLCVDKYDPETQQQSGGCDPVMECPTVTIIVDQPTLYGPPTIFDNSNDDKDQ